MTDHKFLGRLPAALFTGLKQHAAAQGTSINAALIQLLNRSLQNQDQAWRAFPLPDLQRALKLIRQRLGQNLLGMVLFGSVARGQATEKSDIDVLLVVDAGLEINRDLYDLVYSDLQYGAAKQSISLHLICLPQDAQAVDGFLLEIALEGIVLFEKDFTVSRFFMELRRLILEGCFVRESLNGRSYWLLPDRSLPLPTPKTEHP